MHLLQTLTKANWIDCCFRPVLLSAQVIWLLIMVFSILLAKVYSCLTGLWQTSWKYRDVGLQNTDVSTLEKRRLVRSEE